MSQSPLACIEIGGSGVQTVVFSRGTHRFVNGVEVPSGAVVAIAVPGHIVDSRVAAASTLGWTDVDPALELGLAVRPALVCNDAEAAALGEWVLRGRSDPRLVFIGVGSGIGGAVVDDGVVTHCNLFGHQPGFGSRRCSCGRSGCLETVAAGWAMPRPLDGADIERAARAIAAALQAEPAAERGLVVVGGGVAAHYPSLIDRIGAMLPGRAVVGSTRPLGAKSAAAWGMRELLGDGADAAAARIPTEE